MLHRSHSTSSYGRCQCAESWRARHRLVCSSSHSLGIISEPPQFDVPERQPTPDETSSIAAGAKLTPEQQLAQHLQLPITQPVHLPPGAPSPRQLMQRIKAAKTWQELEAAVYQKQELLALQQNTQSQQQQQQPPQQQSRVEQPSAQPLQQGRPFGPPATPSQAEQQQQLEQSPQQQQQQPMQQSVQQPQPLVQAARKQRRKQPVPLLNVTSTSLQLGLSDSADVAQPTPAMSPVQPPTGNSSRSPPTDPPSNSQQQRSSAAPTAQPFPQIQVLTQQQQQQEYQQQPLINVLHVCEAFRKLPALLPQQRGQLSPSERQRVAQLLMHLCQVALQHASDLSFDTRGLAHVLAGLSKLGHRDEALLAELQLAALLAVQDFSSRHAAMLLAALATMGVRPQAELLQALQQHISNTLGLFEGQSLSTTIWALAKLQDVAAAQAQLSPQFSTPDQGSAGVTSGSRSQSAAAFTAAGAGGQGVPVVPRQLVQSLLWRCNPQMHHWSGRDIAQAAWGLAKLGARPNATWRLALLAAAEPKLGKMNVQDLANLLSALPTLRALPEPSWLDTLCSVAATKMWLASPLGVYNLLMGLLRLKQVQHKAAKTAAQRQQQLLQEQSMQEQPQRQEQQQQLLGVQAGLRGDDQEQDAAKQRQPQDTSPGAELLAHDEAHRGVAAASQELPTGENQSPHAPTAAGGDAVDASASPAAVAAASPCAGTLAELRLLKVAAQWLQAHPKALQRWQLAGVICAFGELLPDSKPAQGEQHVQSTSPGPQVETSTQHKQHGALQNGDASATCSMQGSQRRAWERARGSLVGVLQQMVPAWAEEIEGMAKGMGKGRKARYLQLKWAELLSKCGQAMPVTIVC